MNINIYEEKTCKINQKRFEVVETKGKGHPDNICDTLAEKISANYSKYTLDKYNVILRHMVDKLAILGGGSIVNFGGGKMISPIRVLINGRFTSHFKNEIIDYMDIVNKTVTEYFQELFPLLDTNKDLIIINNTHKNEGPGVVFDKFGKTKNERETFFKVLSDDDVKNHENNFRSNDTSTTVGYYPLSLLEKCILEIEGNLNSSKTKKEKPWIGSDIKVMGVRNLNEVDITVCVPLISKYVSNLSDYKSKLKDIKDYILTIINEYFDLENVEIFINTRDNYIKNDLYLTLVGSAVESGDEGVVGRGNRSRGTIPFTRNMSLEAACGKNPVYHTGKIFTAVANIISEKIFKKFNLENIVYITTKMGDDMKKPWNVSIEINGDINDEIHCEIIELTTRIINDHYKISMDLISRKIKVNNY